MVALSMAVANNYYFWGHFDYTLHWTLRNPVIETGQGEKLSMGSRNGNGTGSPPAELVGPI